MVGFLRTAESGHRRSTDPYPLILQGPGTEYSSSMDDLILVPIDVPLVGDERRKNWAKIVTNVDESMASGWAYEGEFIATGGIQDVPVGSIILTYGERGSRTNPQVEARVLKVNNDGTMSLVTAAKGRAWARTLRDEIVQLLADIDGDPIAQIDWDPSLLRYTTEALQEELRRRAD
jgi:hypothetical protein